MQFTLTVLKQMPSFTFLNEFGKIRMDHSSPLERHVPCLKKRITSDEKMINKLHKSASAKQDIGEMSTGQVTRLSIC